jgi:acetoin utilization protein AcuB
MAISNGMKRGCTIKENEIHIRSFSTKGVEKMLVRERMSHPVITIHPDMPLFDALVGIVTEGDLLYAGPSSATTFSVYESNQLLSKYEVKRVMTKSVITISEDTPIEEAACISISNIVSTFPGWGQNQFDMRLDL